MCIQPHTRMSIWPNVHVDDDVSIWRLCGIQFSFYVNRDVYKMRIACTKAIIRLLLCIMIFLDTQKTYKLLRRTKTIINLVEQATEILEIRN